MAQRLLGRRTLDATVPVVGSIPIAEAQSGQLGQLSLSSLRGRQIEYQPYWLELRRDVLAYCRAASKIV